jgi:hypothetical protein
MDRRRPGLLRVTFCVFKESNCRVATVKGVNGWPKGEGRKKGAQRWRAWRFLLMRRSRELRVRPGEGRKGGGAFMPSEWDDAWGVGMIW